MFQPEIINLHYDHVEFFTKLSWENLYHNAAQVVPYYLLGVIFTEHSAVYYDGIALRSTDLSIGSVDPSTGENIRKIIYVAKSCFVQSYGMVEIVIPVDRNRQLEHFQELPDEFFSDDSEFAFDGINFHAALNGYKIETGKCQYIISQTHRGAWGYYSQINLSEDV